MDWTALLVSLWLGVGTIVLLLPFGLWLGHLLAVREFPGRFRPGRQPPGTVPEQAHRGRRRTIRTSVTSRKTATDRPMPNVLVVTSTSRSTTRTR